MSTDERAMVIIANHASSVDCRQTGSDQSNVLAWHPVHTENSILRFRPQCNIVTTPIVWQISNSPWTA
jgi:hypothetical protein